MLGGEKMRTSKRKVWIYIRRNQLPKAETVEKQLQEIKNECTRKRYKVIGETVVEGGCDMTASVLEAIMNNEQKVNYIVSPFYSCLSSDRQVVRQLCQMLWRNRIDFVVKKNLRY